MSDEHDPIDGRIDDGFDRLRSDAQTLDAMAPLRSAHGRRSRFPWGRIVLGGGLIAAVLVFVGMFALGGDDDPDEIVAGPELTTGQELRAILTGEWAFVGGSSVDGDIVVEAADIPATVQARHSGSEEDPAVLEGGARLVVGEAFRQDFTGGQFSVPFLLIYGGCLDYRGEIIDDPELGQIIPTVELLRERCPVDDSGPLPERFFDVLATTTTLSVSGNGSMTMRGSLGVLTFARVTDDDFQPITDTVTDLDHRPQLPIPLTETVADTDDRVGAALLQRLTGTYWELAAGGPDIPMQTAWRPFRMEFPDDGRFFITGMCSWFRGEVGDGPRPFAQVDASPIADTCAAELQAIDATFVAILESVDDAFVDDEAMNGEPALFLTTVDRDLIFIPEVLDLDALTGVRWELDGWDLRADGSVRPVEAPAWFEMRPPVDPDDAQPTGTVRGSTGCIEFSGLWRLVDNQILFINEFDADACGGGIPDQDLQVTYAVGTSVVPKFVGGTVTMYATRDLQASVFRRGAPVDTTDEPLEGTTWELVAMPPFPVPSRGVTIQFDDARFTAQGPCNGFGGSYLLDGEELNTGDHNQSLEGCGDSAESDYFGILTDADRLVPNAGQLVISAGERYLVFEPSDG